MKTVLILIGISIIIGASFCGGYLLEHNPKSSWFMGTSFIAAIGCLLIVFSADMKGKTL